MYTLKSFNDRDLYLDNAFSVSSCLYFVHTTLMVIRVWHVTCDKNFLIYRKILDVPMNKRKSMFWRNMLKWLEFTLKVKHGQRRYKNIAYLLEIFMYGCIMFFVWQFITIKRSFNNLLWLLSLLKSAPVHFVKMKWK